MKRLGGKLTAVAWAVALSMGAAGCLGSPDAPPTAPVSGIVTVKGQPKAGLNVTFQPEAGGRPASGITDENGEFTLTTFNTGDGAIVGTHQAGVAAGSVDENESPPMPGFPGYEEWMKKQREAIDPKYADPKKSGLTYTVPEEGLSDLKIEIP